MLNLLHSSPRIPSSLTDRNGHGWEVNPDTGEYELESSVENGVMVSFPWLPRDMELEPMLRMFLESLLTNPQVQLEKEIHLGIDGHYLGTVEFSHTTAKSENAQEESFLTMTLRISGNSKIYSNLANLSLLPKRSMEPTPYTPPSGHGIPERQKSTCVVAPCGNIRYAKTGGNEPIRIPLASNDYSEIFPEYPYMVRFTDEESKNWNME